MFRRDTSWLTKSRPSLEISHFNLIIGPNLGLSKHCGLARSKSQDLGVGGRSGQSGVRSQESGEQESRRAGAGVKCKEVAKRKEQIQEPSAEGQSGGQQVPEFVERFGCDHETWTGVRVSGTGWRGGLHVVQGFTCMELYGLKQ